MDDKSKAPKADESSSSSATGGAGGDIYEFKSGKESNSSGPEAKKDGDKPHANCDEKAASSPSQPATKDNSSATGTGEKRPLEPPGDDEQEETKKKKRKDDNAGAAQSGANPGANLASTKPQRATRGSSSEKNLTAKSGTSKVALRSSSSDRRSPPTSVNSPRKPQSRDQSDDDDDARKNQASSVGAASGGATSASGDGQLKVPPLKIVLSSGAQSNGQSSAGNAGTSAPGNAATGSSGSTAAPNSSAQGSIDPDKAKNSPSQGDNSRAVDQDKAGNIDLTASGTGNAGSVPAPGQDVPEESGGDASKGPPSSTITRLTRSRANQGTPGPSEHSNDSQASNSQADSVPVSTASGGPGEAAVGNPVPVSSAAATASSGVPAAAPTGTGSNPGAASGPPVSSYTDYHVKKRKLRSQVDEQPSASGSGGAPDGSKNGAKPVPGTGNGSVKSEPGTGSGAVAGAGQSNEPLNDIEKYLNIRKQVEQRRKNLFPVQPKPPQGFKDYLMNRKTYLLQGNAHERLRSIPMIQPPPSLDGPLRELFKAQEEGRYKLRMKHVVEKEKLVLAVEQEILRVHGRAARALANQSLPYSVCTILRDEEIYTPIDPQQEEKNRDIRSRYNGRLFLSWLQDVDDKWEKIKEQMVLRHHNEAESLNAVQKMDWKWKVNEISVGCPASDANVPQMDDLHIPMVHVSDDFDLANS